MEELLAGIVGPRVGNPTLSVLDDSAVVDVPAGKLAFTTTKGGRRNNFKFSRPHRGFARWSA